ncbi:MAG: hypothetical protein U9Q74_13145 [Gemmatimonadota bacterium]|nr:hypothetical protein [Gemmatimonadota bacterium]
MAGGTRSDRLRFGTVVVIGGGCYGSQYVRQLVRAREAGQATWDRLVAVDHDPACALAEAHRAGWPEAVGLDVAGWAPFLERFLGAAAADPARHAADAIVPSPLMPHLLFDWLLARARTRGGGVAVETPAEVAGVPWQREGRDATRYVSHATWTCPVNCIEPATCPHTRGPRDWSMPETLARALGPDVALAALRVTHRTYGVGMVDVADVLAADALIAATAVRGGAVAVATASHCHGAVGLVRLSPVPPPSATGEI